MPFSSHPGCQCLLFDADDTLWENNIYFERVISRFINLLHSAHCPPAQIRALLHEAGLRYIESHGYGTRVFARVLVDVLQQLSMGEPASELQQSVICLAEEILEQPVELLPGVRETLDYLAGRHRLILMTKGDLEEQGGKVERSGLKHYFSAIEIVPRKNTLAYHSVATRHALPRHASWMIGNSPRSDINPALAAGLNAVFVPHPGTSIFEQDTLAAPSGNCKLLQLQTFAELKQYF